MSEATFVFPTGPNIALHPVGFAIRALAEHGMTNLNVLVHATKRIDACRNEIDPKSAGLLHACTHAAALLRDPA